MIRLECDQCDRHIGRSEGDWFGLDYAKLDEDGELVEPSIDHEFHFCSTDCVITWLMNRSYDPQPEEANT